MSTKVTFKVNSKTIIEVQGDKQKDVFDSLASACEVFGERQCGLCGCTDILPNARTVTVQNGRKSEEHRYYEFICLGVNDSGNRCGAYLEVGVHQDDNGTLFPKRKLLPGGKPKRKGDKQEGTYGPHNGWTRYRGKPEDNASTEQRNDEA